MKATAKQRLALFKPAFVNERSGKVTISERSKAGAGSVVFTIKGSCIEILAEPNTLHFLWLQEGRCADGAFLMFDGEDRAHAHIVELKTNLSQKNWASAKRQFTGMFLNMQALLGILGLAEAESATCYIAYSRENLSPAQTASPILLKLRLGTAEPLSATQDWNVGRVQTAWLEADLVKLQRNGAGDAAVVL